jgi:two-component system chemotaxis response regulator CheY
MKRTALIVDDSRAMRLVMGRYLKELGYEVTEAGDGKEALEALNRQGAHPDVALVDWNMPTMNGIELVQAIRREPRFSDVRLMMVTSETEGVRVETALEAGADEYLMKPFTREILVEKLAVLGF